MAGGRRKVANGPAATGAEVALRAERDLLRAAFDTPNVGIIIVGPEGKRLFVNDCAVARTGYTREEYLALPITAFSLPEDVPGDLEWLRRMTAGETRHESRVRRFVRKDGSTYWAAMSVHCARDGEGRVTHLYFFVTDLTELKEAESALKASEERLREAQRIARLGNWELDLPTRRLHWSDEVGQVFGIRPADTGTSLDAFLAAVHPDDLDTVRGAFRRSFETGAPCSVSYRLRLPDGRITIAQVRGEIVRGPGGEPVRIVGTVQDVTELRELQARLAQASRLAAMGTLVAGVAHEINNPLVGVVASDAFAEEELVRIQGLLRSGQQVDLPQVARELDEVIEALADSRTGSRRIAAIVKDMSALSRPDPRRARAALAPIVDEALAWLPVSIRDAATVLLEDLGPPDVMAAPGQIQQVVINLVTNAVKAVRGQEKAQVVVRIGPGIPGTGRIEVVDRGTGIPAALLEKIFEPFFTTREAGQGMGLGLPICHAIVTSHGGTIGVESEPGKGSTFRVELPAAAAAD